MELGLSVFSGKQFLLFYLALMALAWLVSLGIARWLRAEGRGGGHAAMDELAVLAGRRKRLGEAVVARLLGEEALVVDGKCFRTVRKVEGRSPAERTVLHMTSPFHFGDVYGALKQDAATIEERLVDRGWMIAGGDRLQLRLFALIPFALLLLLGYYRYSAGQALGEPVGLLTLLMFATLVLAVVRFFKVNGLTRAGQRVLADAQGGASRLKRAPTEAEMGDAVALYGTGVLAGTSIAAFHSMRQASGGGAGCGSSGCGSDGGGGCGGGGCGGCGG
ncbi:MAG: TIGR04222 domain-containing membrane protein [Sphingomonadales bacterium]|nr:TIGR04222 domain-containing membrane protein [Sphingomonadales bacterium]MBD3773350.1 TIGR04222 domain-containing membrane protein [Paracoccaceae bacterium]